MSSNKNIQLSIRVTAKTPGTQVDNFNKDLGELKNQVMREFVILYIKHVRSKALANLREEREETRTKPTPGGLTETIKGNFAKVFQNGNIRFRLESPGKRYFSWYNERRGTEHTIYPKESNESGYMWFRWARFNNKKVRFSAVTKRSTGFFSEAAQDGLNKVPRLLEQAKANVMAGTTSRPPANVSIPKRIDTRKR